MTRKMSYSLTAAKFRGSSVVRGVSDAAGLRRSAGSYYELDILPCTFNRALIVNASMPAFTYYLFCSYWYIMNIHRSLIATGNPMKGFLCATKVDGMFRITIQTIFEDADVVRNFIRTPARVFLSHAITHEKAPCHSILMTVPIVLAQKSAFILVRKSWRI